MAHMGGPEEGDRVDSLVDSSKGSQGAGRWRTSSSRAWRGLGTVGSAGCAPRGGACWGGALRSVPRGKVPHLSPVLPHPSVVGREVFSYSAAPETRFPAPLKVGAAFESVVKGVRRL